MKKKIILITILFLTIGFAAVTTTLVINVNSIIGTNEEDFDVYFSGAVIDEEDYSNEVINEDRLSISYQTKELAYKGDTSILEYEVTNASKNYDAEVNVVCTGMNEVVTITHTPENQIIEATSIGTGDVIVTLNKTITEEQTIEFTCTLNVLAVERNTLGANEIKEETYILYGNYVDDNEIPIPNANLVIFSEKPHYVTTNEQGYLFYNGIERGSHEIYYVDDTIENIKLMTKEALIEASISSATFTTSSITDITFTNSSKITNYIISTVQKYCNNLLNNPYVYDYTGNYQNFIVPCDGEYKFELWGASGGTASNGGYTSGNILLSKNTEFYVYIGGKGNVYDSSVTIGGWNGGGNTTKSSIYHGDSGGGATDIRINAGTWNNFESLKSRIIVASGGGGNDPGNGAYGGGIIGYSGYPYGNGYYSNIGKGGTQTSGGTTPIAHMCASTNGTSGGFGYGGIGGASRTNTPGGGGSGGGAGYYGGSGASGLCSGTFPGGGGSSFISGHNGCDAISESSTSNNIIHTGQANHYSGYIFTDTIMVDGNGYNWTTEKGEYVGMPTHDGTTTMTGNTGNGYAKITLISLS